MFVALALLSSGVITRTAASGSENAAPEAVFPADAPSLGAIPDATVGGNICGDYGPNKDVTFTVSGLSGTIIDVRVNMSVTHSWVGDLDVRLLGPGGAPSAVVYSNTGSTTATGCGDDSNLTGPYNFFDTAPAAPTWWGAAATAAGGVSVATGDYRVSTAGGVVGGGANALITPTFAATSPNGTWTLRIRDGGEGDTGSVTAASLTITTGGPPVIPVSRVVDFDGDNKTDAAVVRNTGGGPGGQITWFYLNSGTSTPAQQPWGIATDFFVPEDYDGDGKTDIAVWRPGAPFNSYFYILQSQTSTIRTDQFGQSGDDPTVVNDYDGDGKSDPAVYRAGAASGDHSFWYYRGSTGPNAGLIIGTEYGQNGDFPAPGDYDGDGRADFGVQRNGGGGQARFFIRQSTAGDTSFIFGTPTDVIVPGDYDGDLKTDIAVIRGSGGQILWHIRNSSSGLTTSHVFGASATDFPTQGDWDGDSKTDIATWRPNADPTLNFFRWRRSIDGADAQQEWGQNGDYPVANYNAH
jgi:subtilisin-like proprotein convertase family protein